jgi:hypothetical protein
VGSHPAGGTDFEWLIKTSSHIVPVGPPIWVSQRLNARFIAGHGNIGGAPRFVCTQAPHPGQPKALSLGMSSFARRGRRRLLVPMNAHPEPTP